MLHKYNVGGCLLTSRAARRYGAVIFKALLTSLTLSIFGSHLTAAEISGEVLDLRPTKLVRFSELPVVLKSLDCEACGQMSEIPGGKFKMGSSSDEFAHAKSEIPQRTVDIRSFEIGRTEVTQGQWKAVMKPDFAELLQSLSWRAPVDALRKVKSALFGINPSRFKSCGDNCPVDSVSWIEAQNFVKRLNEMTGQQFRLPTEAEWEYAARAGSTSPFWWGSTIDSDKANYNGKIAYKNSAIGIYRETTLRADSMQFNSFGLFQVHGNLWEWVEDCWNENYDGAPSDGSARLTGDCRQRVERGGSWIDTPVHLRSAFRTKDDPEGRFPYSGFRLARSLRQ